MESDQDERQTKSTYGLAAVYFLQKDYGTATVSAAMMPHKV